MQVFILLNSHPQAVDERGFAHASLTNNEVMLFGRVHFGGLNGLKKIFKKVLTNHKLSQDFIIGFEVGIIDQKRW